eukprot:3145773-Amphidinium_carterae.1
MGRAVPSVGSALLAHSHRPSAPTNVCHASKDRQQRPNQAALSPRLSGAPAPRRYVERQANH